MDHTLIIEAGQHFGLEIQQAEPVRGIWRLTTPGGLKCLKRSPLPPPEIKFAGQAIDHLYRQGFHQVAPFQPTTAGEPFLILDNSCFILTDWLAGRDGDYTNPADLEKAAQTLAELHLAARGWQPPPGCADKIRWGQWPAIFAHRGRELLVFEQNSRHDESLAGHIYHHHLPYYIAQARTAGELLAGTAYLSLVEADQKQQLFCHHDFAHHNLLFPSDNRPWVVDFDYAICDLRLHDVASLIIRVLKLNDWDWRLADLIMAVYDRIYPLPACAGPVMLAFFHFPQDFWQVGVWLYLERVSWRDGVERKLEKTLAMEEKRQKFLRYFANCWAGIP